MEISLSYEESRPLRIFSIISIIAPTITATKPKITAPTSAAIGDKTIGTIGPWTLPPLVDMEIRYMFTKMENYNG
jgi:hypothetical protein